MPTRRAALALLATAPLLPRARAQTPLRWATVLGPTHPEAIMIKRIAEDLRARSNGRLVIQDFPAAQLGNSADAVEGTASGAITIVSEGAAAVGQFAPQLSIIEAPYIWRDAAHMAKALASPLVEELNATLVSRRGLRIIGTLYYGKRHLTTGSKPVRTAADMAGFKLRVPPVDVFRAMAEAWGARPTPINFPELYLALSQGAVDGQENPLPTIQSAKLFEVQKFLVLTGHIITPRLVLINQRAWQGLAAADRDLLRDAVATGGRWQDSELASQEQALVATMQSAGMTVIEPDLESFRKPVLDTVPQRFAERWGRGLWERLQAL
jgi:tripartite ATP-independent transporter DctP family solute receptor